MSLRSPLTYATILRFHISLINKQITSLLTSATRWITMTYLAYLLLLWSSPPSPGHYARGLRLAMFHNYFTTGSESRIEKVRSAQNQISQTVKPLKCLHPHQTVHYECGYTTPYTTSVMHLLHTSQPSLTMSQTKLR